MLVRVDFAVITNLLTSRLTTEHNQHDPSQATYLDAPMPSTPPCTTDTSVLAEHSNLLNDLDYISRCLRDQRHLMLSGTQLVFAVNPVNAGGFRRRSPRAIASANTGLHALEPKQAANYLVLDYENDLFVMLTHLRLLPGGIHDAVEQLRSSLLDQVYDEIDRIESLKESEWNRQQAGIPPLSAGDPSVFRTGASLLIRRLLRMRLIALS